MHTGGSPLEIKALTVSVIASYPKDKQNIILVAADAFMAGLSAKNATEDKPELLKKEG